jgi:hypothetical protein
MTFLGICSITKPRIHVLQLANQELYEYCYNEHPAYVNENKVFSSSMNLS